MAGLLAHQAAHVLGRHLISCAVVPEVDLLLSVLRLLLYSKGAAQQFFVRRKMHVSLKNSDPL